MKSGQHFNIIGGGLAGALLAILLAQRGRQVTVYEKRSDPRRTDLDAGRSINLVLAARGFAALQAAGVMAKVHPLLLPMSARMVHQPGKEARLLPYGSRPHEVIWSVSRGNLNRALIAAAAAQPGVTLHFDVACTGVDTHANTLQLRPTQGGPERSVTLGSTIATDGAGSPVRHSLEAASLVHAREELLDHDYKELTIPASHGDFALDPTALHIWPRGGFMLIALPNPEKDFTATLFLSRRGTPGFESLRDTDAVRSFFHNEFPGTAALMPQREAEFLAHPQGILGTVHCDRWHVGGQLLLLGDAAHAIVPFHGQGANCAFEDCLQLATLIDQSPASEPVENLFAALEASRRPNAEAIAQMALENYTEMRDSVRDPRFERLKRLSLQLEQRHPQRFIPRYSMVMFHAEIPYAEALRRGAVQAQLLTELDAAANGAAVDLDRADQLIHDRLPPLPRPGAL